MFALECTIKVLQHPFYFNFKETLRKNVDTKQKFDNLTNVLVYIYSRVMIINDIYYLTTLIVLSYML